METMGQETASLNPKNREETGFVYRDFFSFDGARLRTGKLQSPAGRDRGILLILNGRAEFMEKYTETACLLRTRGYDVLSLDWRGQGLSVRELHRRHKGYVRDFSDYLQDLSLFHKRFVLPEKRPLTLLAHSMGAHIALRFMHDHPDAVQRAVLVAPMIDIDTGPFPRRLAKKLAAAGASAGLSRRYIPGAGGYRASLPTFRANVLTHDRDRFEREKFLIASNPALALGGVTWGWLSAAFSSIRILNDPAYAGAIRTPLLMAGAGREKVVCNAAQERLADLLPSCERIVLNGAYHEILMETDAIQDQFWRSFDRFTQAA